MLMRLKLISIIKFNTSWFAVYLQKTLHFLVFWRNIGLKTSKHEFTDKIHQNKQGFEGKKLSGKEFLAFEEYQRVWKTWPARRRRRIARKDSLYRFLTSIFAFHPPESFKIICFTCIWSQFVDTSFHSLQNPQQTPRHISQFSNQSRPMVNTWIK